MYTFTHKTIPHDTKDFFFLNLKYTENTEKAERKQKTLKII